MKIEIILPYPGLTTTKGTIFDAQDKETPEDVTGDDTGDDTGEDTGDTGDDTGNEQAQ
jgi:hypothetical protein